MARKHSPDIILLAISCALVFFGILILASVSASFSVQKFGTTFYFFSHQLLYGLLPGILLGALAFFLPLQTLKKLAPPLLLFCIFLLALTFAPGVGGEIKGAYRWVFFGPISFQPSEFLKLAFILYTAAWLSSRTEKKWLRSGKGSSNTLLFFGIVLGLLSVFLVLQPDISTLGILSLTGLAMYFLASTPFWHTGAMLVLGTGLLFFLIHVAPYRFSRLAVFLNPSLDPLGQGYQIKQALIGIGSGGLTGVGLGLSFQKFGTLPEPISDSIFAIFAEEMGFVGSALLLVVFLAFAWRSFIIAQRAHDSFARLTALGIGSWITLQALVNIGSMTGIFPLAGIPLPFISYGGSALLTELIALGILLNISKQA